MDVKLPSLLSLPTWSHELLARWRGGGKSMVSIDSRCAVGPRQLHSKNERWALRAEAASQWRQFKGSRKRGLERLRSLRSYALTQWWLRHAIPRQPDGNSTVVPAQQPCNRAADDFLLFIHLTTFCGVRPDHSGDVFRTVPQDASCHFLMFSMRYEERMRDFDSWRGHQSCLNHEWRVGGSGNAGKHGMGPVALTSLYSSFENSA